MEQRAHADGIQATFGTFRTQVANNQDAFLTCSVASQNCMLGDGFGAVKTGRATFSCLDQALALWLMPTDAGLEFALFNVWTAARNVYHFLLLHPLDRGQVWIFFERLSNVFGRDPDAFRTFRLQVGCAKQLLG